MRRVGIELEGLHGADRSPLGYGCATASVASVRVRPAVTIVSPTAICRWPAPGPSPARRRAAPGPGPGRASAWSRATTLDRASTTSRTVAESGKAATTLPASAPWPFGVGDHRHPDPHAVVGPRVDPHLPGEVARVAGQDPDRQEVHLERRGEAEQPAQLRVLGGRLTQLGQARLRARQLATQAIVLASGADRSRRSSVKKPAIPDPTPAIAPRTGSSARAVTSCSVTAGPVARGEQQEQREDGGGGEPEAAARLAGAGCPRASCGPGRR